MMRKRKPTDLIQLKIRMTEAMRAALEGEAKRRGTSINFEVVYRLDRSFDRNQLLPEVLALPFGRRLAGLLMSLAFVMGAAASGARQGGVIHSVVNNDDWVLDVGAYHAARTAAHMLLDLWEPTLQALNKSKEPEEFVRITREIAMKQVEDFITLLNREMKNPTDQPTIRQAIEFLGPVAEGMIENFPQAKESHEAALKTFGRTKRGEAEKTPPLKKRA